MYEIRGEGIGAEETSGGWKKKERLIKKTRHSLVCVCVCVCVRERERDGKLGERS